ncbi:hypothetical protein GCK32_006000 [Trichostrongylus colubriformis]|uniref:Uncharacterized protein n=1 Tax=Trichostrongylus colubriformis TaxID=6319 RepID=A0AAN8INZ8_TRICO
MVRLISCQTRWPETNSIHTRKSIRIRNWINSSPGS